MIDQLPVSLLPASVPTLNAGTQAAMAPDVALFQAAMESPAPVSPAEAPLAAAVQNPASMGDAIIAGLQAASADVQSKWGHVSTLLANKELSITEALNVQMNVLQVSVQYDLISKGISKTVQNLDQTLKTQ